MQSRLVLCSLVPNTNNKGAGGAVRCIDNAAKGWQYFPDYTTF